MSLELKIGVICKAGFSVSKILLMLTFTVCVFNAYAANEYETIDWKIPDSKFADFGVDYQYVLIAAAYATVIGGNMEGWVVSN